MNQTNLWEAPNHGFQVGTSYGGIHYHGQPERPEVQPSPFAHIPFRRDPGFVQRVELLGRLANGTGPGRRVALVGLGGVGKSNLALDYAYQLRDQHPDRWVLWLRASTFGRLAQDAADIVERIKMPGRRDPQASRTTLLSEWLRDSISAPWFLVVDNVDDTTTKDGSNVRSLLDSLSDCMHGCIVITTRADSVASTLVEQEEILDVQPMNIEQAKELLRRKLGDPHQDLNAIAKLATTLDAMPLALAQAAAYITKREPRCSVSQYLELLRVNDQVLLDDIDDTSFRRERAHTNAIYLTWRISFIAIQQSRPSAADLLSLMCFFDRQAIPESALRAPSTSEDTNRAVKNPRDQHVLDDPFERDILMLRDYKFISITAEEATMFEMHRLVQRATQRWLTEDNNFDRWRSTFAAQLDAVFPITSTQENRAECMALVPHVKFSIPLEPPPLTDQRFALQWASLLYRTGHFLLQESAFEDGEQMATLSYNIRQRFQGDEEPTALRSKALLLRATWLRGRYLEAIDLGELLLSTMENVLGSSHAWTLDALNDLALSYQFHVQLEKALEGFTRLYEVYSGFPDDDANKLVSMTNLAQLYVASRRCGLALMLLEKVHKARIKLLGEDSRLTLNAAHNLAVAYMEYPYPERARRLFVQMLDKRKALLGEEHLGTLNTMGSLAGVLRSQGRLTEAESLATQTLKTRERILGSQHPETLLDMSNLALILKDSKKFADAFVLSKRCAELSSMTTGIQHDKLSNRWALVRELQAFDPDLKAYTEQSAQGSQTAANVINVFPETDEGMSTGNLLPGSFAWEHHCTTPAYPESIHLWSKAKTSAGLHVGASKDNSSAGTVKENSPVRENPLVRPMKVSSSTGAAKVSRPGRSSRWKSLWCRISGDSSKQP